MEADDWQWQSAERKATERQRTDFVKSHESGEGRVVLILISPFQSKLF